MRLQFFAEDNGTGGADGTANSDMDELNTLLNGMDNGSTGDAGTNTGADEASGSKDGAGQQQSTDEVDEQKATPSNNKQEFAFAQMRTQNNQLLGLLSKVAQATGLEFKDNNDLIEKLNDDALNKLAKTQNVPVELLKRMETLEQTGKLYEAQQLQSSALEGFQKLKTSYELSEEDLRAFAAELDEAGKNPFLTKVDLEKEYQLNHFNDILTKATQKAVEEALKKSNAADQHSSTPNSTQGKSDTDGGDKITTVRGLDDLLKDMK